MPSDAIRSGQGTKLVLSTGTYDATGGVQINSITLGEASRESIETTHLGTAVASSGYGSRTWIPALLTDPGTMAMNVNFNPDKTPPLEDASDTLTITFFGPDGVAGAIWVIPGHCTGFELNEVTHGEPMTAVVTYKLSGNIGITADA